MLGAGAAAGCGHQHHQQHGEDGGADQQLSHGGATLPSGRRCQPTAGQHARGASPPLGNMPAVGPGGQPPANGGSTSMTAPSARSTASAARPPACSPSTRNEDRASTARNSAAAGRRATASASASASVVASSVSSATPAACFAAAQ